MAKIHEFNFIRREVAGMLLSVRYESSAGQGAVRNITRIPQRITVRETLGAANEVVTIAVVAIGGGSCWDGCRGATPAVACRRNRSFTKLCWECLQAIGRTADRFLYGSSGQRDVLVLAILPLQNRADTCRNSEAAVQLTNGEM